MRLKLLRLESDIEIEKGHIATLEIHDHRLFTRVVRSLMSGESKYADEPYLLYTDDDKPMPAKNSIMLIHTLPALPLNDRTLIAKLHQTIIKQIESQPDRYGRLMELMGRVNEELEQSAEGLWGDYSFAKSCEFVSYLKAFSFAPLASEDYSLLDNCIRFLGLCADAEVDLPIVLINAKSFFDQEELEELFDQAFFLDSRLVLIESWKDDRRISREVKTVIDLHFLGS